MAMRTAKRIDEATPRVDFQEFRECLQEIDHRTGQKLLQESRKKKTLAWTKVGEQKEVYVYLKNYLED